MEAEVWLMLAEAELSLLPQSMLLIQSRPVAKLVTSRNLSIEVYHFNNNLCCIYLWKTN